MKARLNSWKKINIIAKSLARKIRNFKKHKSPELGIINLN